MFRYDSAKDNIFEMEEIDFIIFHLFSMNAALV